MKTVCVSEVFYSTLTSRTLCALTENLIMFGLIVILLPKQSHVTNIHPQEMFLFLKIPPEKNCRISFSPFMQLYRKYASCCHLVSVAESEQC